MTVEWESLNKALDEVLELDPGEYDTYLERVRGDDPPLANELGRLLAARQDARFDQFLSGSFPTPIETPAETGMIGRVIGAWRIDAEIGSDGLGTRWQARPADGRSDAAVSVRFLPTLPPGQVAAARFRHDAARLARLEHPAIARLLEADVSEGLPYLVFEHPQGEPLDQYCELRALSMPSRCRLFLTLLDAVACGHRHLIAHLALEGASVRVVAPGEVKVLDFGVAMLLAANGAAADLAAQLKRPPATAQDLEALGALLQLVLAGAPRAPHGAARASRTPGLSVARRRALEGDLDAIIERAATREPAVRYPSVQALAEDLERQLAGEAVRAAGGGGAYRARKFLRRHGRAVVLAALAMLALGAVTVLTLWQAREARAQRESAQYEANRAGAQNELTRFLLGDSLASASPQAVSARLERARDMIHRRFAQDPQLQAYLLMDLSEHYLDARDAKGSESVLEEAESIGRATGNAAVLAGILCGRAQDAVEDGDVKAARRLEAEGLGQLTQLAPAPPGLHASCAMASATIAEQEADFGRAEHVLAASLAALKAAELEHTSRYASVAHERARALLLGGRFRDAWFAEQALMADISASGRDDGDTYFAMVNVGATALIEGGEPEQALALIERVAGAPHESPESNLPFYLEASRELAGGWAGELPQADLRLDALASNAEIQGAAAAVPLYRSAAVELALERGALAQAGREFDALTRALDTRDSPPRSDRLRGQVARARLLTARGETAAALESLARAAQLVPPGERGGERLWGQLLNARAAAELAARDYAAALATARAAAECTGQQAIEPGTSRWKGEALLHEARAEAGLGDRDAARRHAAEALRQLRAAVSPKHPLLLAAQQLSSD